ncbi:MAG: cyclopentanol dehydrogenase [Candidatus Poseidoniales archaeon]|nr:glucose 1-dehydrogenase [Dehalococcoidia bacterium]PKB81422.1 MAG: cyclopentanol dehydrogenase [SAR202 cluster bacterium MP-SInd-SRR3963457-G1]PKB85895.1 MAG: cyclopentanol dehydrogenase [SAR202 cluster bacterium MP-NPac-SRR3961935-G1]RTZ95148.1 MAG: cyclopentanol dehydrogenase [Candidatus Poseidoniales archaeon]RUA32528.1 MAG: cyclopentanol dehydrogenase [Chloroflexota bacterium]
MRLQGKVALITGAARGQGAEEARMFAKEGAKVVLADVTDQEGMAVAAEIAEAGGDALYVHLDVTNEDEWDAAVQSAVAAFGKLDILVNNAGIWRRGHVLETSSDQWDDIMDVNAKGVFLGTKAAIPEMRKAGGGSIVNISSTAGLVGSKTSAAYSASKGAVRIFTKSTAVQYAAEGIRANSIHPGPIDTDMGDQVWPDAASREASISRTALSRIGTAQDIAYGALYLASEESSFVTGSELVIDGGVTAQ